MRDLILRPSSLLGTSIFSDIDRLFDDMLEPLATTTRQLSLPSADVFRQDNDLVVEVQAPGFGHDDIEISVDNGTLEIRGEKTEKEEHKDKKRSYMVRENSTSFYRRIPLPEGSDTEKIGAELENGMLRVTIPVERRQAKRIQIAGGGKKSKAKITTKAGSSSEAE